MSVRDQRKAKSPSAAVTTGAESLRIHPSVITHPDSRRFSRALRSAILWPACVIFFTAFLMLLMIFLLMRVVKWSEHSYAVLSHARTCEEMVAETQSQVRGYILNGNPAFKTTFPALRQEADHAFLDLKGLVKDNPQQVIRVENLIESKDLWFQHAKERIDDRTAGAPDTTQAMQTGLDLMAHLRGRFQNFIQVEEELHEQRVESVQRTKRGLGLAAGLLAVILAVTVGQLVRRQFVGLAVDYESALRTIEQRHASLVRSEAELEEQKEWFRVTLSSIGDGVIVTDREGRIVFINHEAERLTGWNNVEALLKPLGTVFRPMHEDTRVRVEDPVARVFKEGKVVGMARSTVLASRSGDEYPIEDSAAPISDSGGNILGVVLVFHNATDMRQAQNALRIHSEDLEKRVTERTSALRQTVTELESFSYTISHDLRSPLRAMQGFAQAVLEDYGEKLDDQGRNYLDRIKKAAERLDRLIQDLLSYTRIARQDAPLLPLDADRILRDIIENYPNLHSPAAEVTVEGSVPRVLGHEASLTQVLSNLLGNAAKFVPEGTLPRIRVWARELDGRIRIWVEDNGIGIPPDDYDRIFQMFVQVNESQLYGGTGVGLAIVKKAVESMQGSLGVEPAENGGTRFWVELAKAH
jgi:PAS domain S-box-containing protein